jgi:nucleoid-associated protein YgaU
MSAPHQVKLSVSYNAISASTDIKTTSDASGRTYTVAAGDTLWSIAKKYYGSGIKADIIYNANVDIIESTAKAHGKTNSDNGHWIWAGEILTIPGVPEQENAGIYNVNINTIERTGIRTENSVEAFSYNDIASGQSDSISITFANVNKEWLGNQMPKRGAAIGVKINTINWNTEDRTDVFDCGNFILDDISFSGSPLSCVLNGVSVPAMNDFKSLPRSETWEKTTIRDIAERVVKRAGVSLFYEAEAIQIVEVEQNREPDSSFLYALCEKYGLGMKVYNHKIIILDLVKCEEKSAILTISDKEMISWSYNTTVEGTYTGVSLDYTDPDEDKSINVTMGTSGRMYAMNTQASSKYDAEIQAAAKVNDTNRSIETMNVSIRANQNIVASQCINITGLSKIDGKYFIDAVRHSIGNGYTMQLEMHKVQTPIKVTASVTTPTGNGNYTVVAGDTLWMISRKFYGTGKKYDVIYNANVDIIESTAKAHGKSSSDNGHWIWAGEILIIP